MSNRMTITSRSGPYDVVFEEEIFETLNAKAGGNYLFVVDSRVADLYSDDMGAILAASTTLLIEATEENKSLDRLPEYIQHLVDHQVRRDHQLIAIGGGVIQDITCFIASTFLRGVEWQFVPTTLLAQADSCIGSKSSINCGKVKNILGTFYPPRQITITSRFLKTLDSLDMRSGVGEILKAHAIDGPESFAEIAAEYDHLFTDDSVTRSFVRRSLEIKKDFVEQDEFDRNIRNVLNYGHTFGHAIESATDFAIPHGIAVTMGMDMANYIAFKFGVCDEQNYLRMHPVFMKNYKGFEDYSIPVDDFISAISKDKKNLGSSTVALVLPDKKGRIFKDSYPNDGRFRDYCAEYLAEHRTR